ncbi:tryptophan synthase subunit alpha [Streptomyces sp. NPDC091292]|uniref:tryptophan synthase subunit alpha n=1 Tax=Streptomyces sp. NPDC091292 TaxID=3365991 RepID=UPI0037F5EFA1
MSGTPSSGASSSGARSGGGQGRLLADTLAAAKADNRAALIAYLPAGFPTVDGGIEAVKAVFDGGADIVEVGLPHSDPVLDGPVIQTADDIALRGGVKIADVMRTVREAHEATGKPVLVMTYWNPIDRYGVERFTTELAEAGGAGCILPDLPVQESAHWREHAEKHGLTTVFVVAPSSKDVRLAEITAAGSGFVYAASLMGVTGTRESVGAQAQDLVRRTRATTDLPVCVGLGVSNADQAAEVAGFADGVIVGSAFVKRMLDAPDAAAGLDAVRALAGDLARGVRRGVRRGV